MCIAKQMTIDQFFKTSHGERYLAKPLSPKIRAWNTIDRYFKPVNFVAVNAVKEDLLELQVDDLISEIETEIECADSVIAATRQRRTIGYNGKPLTNLLDILPQNIYEKIMKPAMGNLLVEIHAGIDLKRKGIVINGYNDFNGIFKECSKLGHQKNIDTGLKELIQTSTWDFIKNQVFLCPCEYHKKMYGPLPISTSRSGKQFIFLCASYRERTDVKACGAKFGTIIIYDQGDHGGSMIRHDPYETKFWYTTPDHPNVREMIIRFGVRQFTDFVFKPMNQSNPFR